MAILTRQQLASIARSKAGSRGLRGIVNEARAFSKTTADASIFLSHAHDDKDVVEQAKLLFENLGVRLYVDWADKTLPESPNETTAVNIKHQIISGNDKFVLLATNKAVLSKWCNWELGIADPFKLSNKKMAILPLSDNNGAWLGNEYLRIYPRIEENERQAGGKGYYVWYPDGSWDPLDLWLSRK